MDFQKLNIEFSNMQNMITKYNELLLEIKNRIRNNLKEISKYETKIKNTKNNLENECYKILVISLKNETTFLENIIIFNFSISFIADTFFIFCLCYIK